MERILRVCKKSNICELDWNKIIIFWDKIATKFDIFESFSRELNFPDYFWNNWDAFCDMISDVDFVTKDITVIIYAYDKRTK